MTQNSITTGSLSKKFDSLSDRVDGLSNKVDVLATNVGTLTNKLDEFIVFSMEHVATKEDLKGFATKEDLNRFATKEDLFDLRCEMNIQKLDIIDRMDDKFADLKADFKKEKLIGY